MLTMYSPHISEVLPLSLTMAITMIFDITSYTLSYSAAIASSPPPIPDRNRSY